MHLTRITCYAIAAATKAAAYPGDSVSTASVPGATALPDRFPRIVVQALVDHGILAWGDHDADAVVLARPAGQISLLEIIEAVEGRLLPSCSLAPDFNPAAASIVEAALESVAAFARQRLSAVTVANLLSDDSANVRPTIGALAIDGDSC